VKVSIDRDTERRELDGARTQEVGLIVPIRMIRCVDY
jgi:hypothetical protein